jgi:hypothetical protein
LTPIGLASTGRGRSTIPAIPAHENKPYVERARELLAGVEQAMRGRSAAFGSRSERGWVPPSTEDVRSMTEEHASEQAGAAEES